MAIEESRNDGAASRLLLDIKALTILYPSDSSLKEVLEKSFVDYSDDDVRRLTDIIRPGRKGSRSGSVLVATAEMIFAAFLAVLGIGSFVPSIIGTESPQQFFGYFTQGLSTSFSSGPLAEGASIIELAFSVLLIVGSLYLLRRSATDLKEAGLVVEASRN